MKKALFLFEVAFVVLIVSVLSLFIVRGYGLFLKVGKKSVDYLNVLYFIDQKLCQLHIQEKANQITQDLEKQGAIDFKKDWQLVFKDTEYPKLLETNLNLLDKDRKQNFFDLTLYLKKKTQENEKEN